VASKHQATTVNEVCNVSGITKECFSDSFYRYKKLFPQYAPEQAPVALAVAHVLKELNIESSELAAITSKTIKIIDLLNDMGSILDAYNVEGKNPTIVIIAAALLAWKSVDLRTRKNVSLKNFCIMHKVHVSIWTTIGLRNSEIRKNLVILTKYLPWLKFSKIDTKNVIFELDGILENAGLIVTEHKLKGLMEQDTLSKPMPHEQRPQVPQLDDEHDEDLDDDEIDGYIRTPQETKALAANKRKLETIAQVQEDREHDQVQKKQKPQSKSTNQD
jgi:hypothetical protein